MNKEELTKIAQSLDLDPNPTNMTLKDKGQINKTN